MLFFPDSYRRLESVPVLPFQEVDSSLGEMHGEDEVDKVKAADAASSDYIVTPTHQIGVLKST